MKVTNEKTEKSQAYLTIEMEPAEMEESLEKAYRQLVVRTSIPGFRVGKAPRAVLERQLGKEKLLREAINNLVPEAYEKAIKEQSIEAIAQPEIEIKQTTPLVFQAVVPLKPTVKMGDYHSIQVTAEPVEVTDDDVKAVIEQLRHQHATWEPVERPVELGDLVTLNIQSTIEGKPFIGQKGFQYHVLAEVAFPMPGFAEQLVATEKNKEKEFKLSFPADFSQKELAGKEVSFKVEVTEIKHEVLPEVNNDFAQLVNPELKTVDTLKERALTDLKARAEERARLAYEEKAIDAAVERAEVEFPSVLAHDEVHHIIDQRFRDSKEFETYLKSANKTMEQVHEELEPIANKRVTRSLVLGKVAEEEKIEAGKDEIDAEIERMLTSTKEEEKDRLSKLFNTEQARESIADTIITRKTIQRLVDIAKASEGKPKTDKEEGK